MPEKKPNPVRFIRPIIAVICILAGGLFLFIPFIPLGYILVIAGVFLLVPEIPALQKLLKKLNEKDDKNRVEKVVKKVEETEEKINNTLRNDREEKTGKRP